VNRPRVLLADDHKMMLAGLHKLLEDTCEIVGTAQDGRALVEAAQRLEPDLIILDIGMPLLNGIDAARQIKALCPGTKLIFLTMQTSPTYATEALQAGASGYLLKHSAPMELPLEIEAALQGHHYLTPSIAKPVLESTLSPERGSLAKRSVSEIDSPSTRSPAIDRRREGHQRDRYVAQRLREDRRVPQDPSHGGTGYPYHRRVDALRDRARSCQQSTVMSLFTDFTGRY
jgi:DNA-binding NarL/FixJ family response regulator